MSITWRDNYPWFTGSRKASTCEVSIIRVWGAKPSRLPETRGPVSAGSSTGELLVFPADRETNVCSASTERLITLTTSLILCSTCSKIFSGGNAYIRAFGHGIVSASRLGEIVTGRRTEGYAGSPPLQTGQTPNRSSASLSWGSVFILCKESHSLIAYPRRCLGYPERARMESR